MKRRALSFVVTLALCLNLCPVWVLAADEGTSGGLCAHHPAHTDECGYVSDDPGAPCTFVCQICPIEELIDKLPASVSADNSEQVQAQLSEIYALCDGLTGDELRQVDLSLCVSLLDQIDGLEAEVQSDTSGDSSFPPERWILNGPQSFEKPFEVTTPYVLDTNGHTVSGPNSTAIQVTASGDLDLKGTVVSSKGAGVEVLSGGSLRITEQSDISGQTYALDIASGATVYLSAGTFTGKSAAIRMESGDFASLLAQGFAYFDENGSPLLPEDVEMARTVVVKQCAGHSQTYTANPGSPTHSWACEYCGTGETEKCTFDFDGNVQADCREQCGHSITVTVNESALGDLIYNGADQTANVTLTVSLEDGTTLAKDTDYKVDYSARTDVGDITVTVTGITFDGTFIKTYHIDPDQPGIRWDNTTCAVDYDSEGRPVDSAKLPHITINIKAPNDEDLRAQLQYSYREAGTADEFVDGLPANAGEYEVKAYIPKSQNYEAAETNPCLTLTINKIDALLEAPVATRPTYDKTSHPLVTAGKVQNGAVIEYAREESGPYTPDIPTGVNAGDYFVWYRVTADTNNYNVVPETEVPGVEILRKPITPLVILSEDSFLYDGGYKRPGVTVKDKDDGTVLLETEYAVDYENNLNVSTAGNPAKAIVTDEPGGNYDVQRVEVEFEITSRPQETLSITQKPNSITYGDQFTLGTTGGSGSGDVTWEITSGTDVATVDSGGHVTVIGHGSATVKATKSGADPTSVTPAADGANYGDATDSWTFTAVKKPVVATVTAEDKDYDGNKKATVHAVVEQGILAGDVITIDDLPGEFIDENAGVDKTVNVDTSSPVISGTNFEHYDVSYSSTTVKATIRKAIAKITTEPVAAALTYNGTAQALIAAGAVVDTAGIDVEYALSEEGPYSTDFPKATYAGNYTVWYRVKETGNYTGAAPKNVTAAINKKPVSPVIALDQDSFTYDGTAKEPAVTLTEPDGTIPDSEYTVSYSDNVNAGAATVAVTARADGNYTFTPDPVTETFTISEEKAQVVTAPKAAANPIFYNTYAQELVTAGTGTGGTMVYSTDNTNFSDRIPVETNAGDYTVYYKVAHDANHSDSDVGQVQVTIAPKTVKDPTIELFNTDGTPLVSYTYDGTAKTPKVVVKDGSTVIGTTDAAGENDEYNVIYTDNTGAGKATVSITAKPGGNYTVSGTTTFQITKKAPAVTPPEGRTGLKYNGELQELVKAGACDEGAVYYSVNGGSYSPAIPTASAVGTYTITYKVLGDANHSDTDPVTLQTDVEIDKNRVSNPTITLSSDTFKYNGSQQKPVITVRDDDRKLIPENEYTVTIEGSNGNVGLVDVDTYTITITTPGDSNYVINSSNTRTYTIVKADQEAISITGTKAQVFYGDAIQLGTTGGAGSGTITWTVTGSGTVNSRISPTGLLTVNDVGGPFTVTVTHSRGGNYTDASATWEFSADPKPVTAEVTAADRGYIANDDTATVTATVPDSELVSGDAITITGLTGRFDNPNAGTNKKVTVDRSTLNVSGINWDKYSITYPAAVTASIFAAEAAVDTEPEAVSPLIYDASQAQELVTAGHTNDGIMVYSLDGANFTPNIPKGKDAGTYRVYYKAQGDGNHTDSVVGTKDVTIARQTVTPQVELSPPGGQYDGNVKRPEVTVRDTANNVIPVSEYTVVYDPATNWKDVGPHKVTVKNVEGGNYIITEKDETFTISTTEQNPLEIVNKPGLVYYGDTFTLSTTGGSGSGKIEWSSSDEDVAKVDENGLVTIEGTGSATITAKKPGGTNYEEAEAAYPLNALKKPVTAIVTAEDRVYVSGNTNATLHVTWEKGALVGTDSIDTTPLSGTFADENVGTNKIVTITGAPVDDVTAQKYDITIPPTTTASILKADAAAPALTKNDRDYNGLAQDLVTGGDASTLYSDSRDGVYSTTVPQGTNAGTYTVWYKEQGDVNHNDSAPQSIQVTIRPKQLTADATNTELSGSDLKTDTSGTSNVYYYEYDGAEKKPTVTIKDGAAVVPASEYTVGYSDNKNVSTADKKATVTITDSGDGNYVVSGSISFEIRQSGAQLVSSPQAKDLTYTGQEQELVTVGTAAGGHIEYALDNGSYGTAIPKAENAGTYTVSYRVVGDSNHTGGETGSVSVTIKPKQVISPKITVSGSYAYTSAAQIPADGAVTVEDGGKIIPSGEYSLSYRDNINAGTATVIVSDNNGGNYTVNGTATFEIARAEVNTADITPPTGKENLPYNGTAQELVAGGAATGGTMVYSLSETGEYSPAIPTGKDVKAYTVWYKIQGDSNHKDTTPVSVSASIVRNTVTNPTIQVTPESVTYNGEKQVPAVTVWDGSSVIDGSEYTVTYSDAAGNPTTDLTAVGTYTLTITGNGNYIFDTTDGRNTAAFEILPAGQTPLTITGRREHVYYGDTFQLSAEGGNGTVEWNVDDSSIASISNGLLTIKGVGSVTVTAISKAAGYKDQTATWPFVAEKKPVTAVVTAAPKTYNGDTDATVTAVLQSSDLVSGDDVQITLKGDFEDPNAGTNKKVNIDSKNPSFAGSTGNYEYYSITYPATATASIFKMDISAGDITEPELAAGLEYTGDPQNLVKAGSVTGGIMEYSLDGRTYSASLPTGVNAGDYDVWYRVKGDGNHNDKEGVQLGTATIARQEVTNPTIEFTPSGASYDGQEHKPSVTVKDANGSVIPATEYTVSYGATDWIKTGDHTVTITGKPDGNYDISGTPSETFTILPAGQSPLTIVGQPGSVQYGDSFTLSAVGGSGTGAVIWEKSDADGVISINSQTGQVEILKSGGPVTVTARKLAAGGYSETTASWTFSAKKKPVTPIVTARDKEYDTDSIAQLVITWAAGDLLANDVGAVNLDGLLEGTFDNANVGSNKNVTIQLKPGAVLPAGDKYDIKLPTSTTASITPKAASVSGATATELTFNGGEQALVSGVTAVNGTLAYSRDGSYYTLNVPKETNAGTYTIWYKAQASGNYMDSPAVRVDVTIKPKEITPVITLSQDSYEYDGTAKEPGVVVKDGSTVIPASEYTVSYSSNTAVGTATVTVSNVSGGNYSFTGSKTFTIQAGTAAVKDAPKANNLTYNGFSQELVTEGTAVNGQMVYSETRDGSYNTSIPMKTDAGSYQVWYKVQGDNGAADTTPKSVNVTIQPKEVTPIIRLENRSSYSVPYNGSTQEPEVTVYVESKLYNGLYDVEYSNNINVGTAEVTVQSMGGNYQFLAFKTFTITKGKAEFLSAPAAKQNLVYTGETLKLVNPGYAKNNGTVLYSLDNSAYSTLIPTAINRDSYTVFAKVQGSDNYEESDVVIIPVEIGVNTVQNPVVTLSSGSFPYTGSEHKPTVTVTDDDSGNVIPADEYTVTYSDNVAVGTAKVNIKSKPNGNYSFTASANFQIVAAGQTPLTITGRKDTVYYGDTLNLGTTGGSGSGAVTWSVTGPVDILADGQYKINSSGSVTITAAKAASSGYEASTDTWSFYANPKPVTAVVTAADKPYDGDNTAALTATVNSGLVGADVSFTVTAAGHFSDANVGTNKTVVIDDLTVPPEISAKYDISWPSTTTASITQAAAKVTDLPRGATGLVYTGSPQALLAGGGTAEGGNLAYSIDGGSSYSFDIPKAVDAGDYTVWYKVIANDENHKDSIPAKMDAVTIGVNTYTPTVLCTPGTFQYDGTEKTPTVVVRDNAQRIIPESEYTVTLPASRTAAGTYNVTVTDKPGGNYEFSGDVIGTFTIAAASQNPLSIITDKPTDLYYGDTFRLTAMGGSGNGAIQWSVDNPGIAEITSVNGNNCVVTVKGTGGFTVEAYREAADGYSQSNTDSVPFVANPKPVTPVVTAKDKPYDGTKDAELEAVWKAGDLVGNDNIPLTVAGEFVTADVGTDKQVIITSKTPDGVNGNYIITWPESARASISKVDAKLENPPTGRTLSYTGDEHALVNGGSTEKNVGTIEYSLSQNGQYSTTIPTGRNAGKYTVWYRVADSVNYTGVPAASIEVEIARATPTISHPTASTGTVGQSLKDITFSNGGSASVDGRFAWKDGSIKPEVGTSSQVVVFTPIDTANYNVVEFSIDVTIQSVSGTDSNSGGGTGSTSSASTAGTPTTVQNGTASTVLSASDGSRLVREAVANQSQNIVIKPEVAGDVTKSQVSLPASTVSQIKDETDAALTVSAPIADVTIPNAALDTLGGAGGTVSVVTEQVDQGVVLTLTAGGEKVEDIPGGVTLSIPVENAGPGTVAVLVHDDGTRETIQKSVVEDGKVNIPLNGSATVEIVDNSKEFTDVPSTNWAADAVAFASAHELFSGTSETTFSPDQAMSRGMLTTVLYNLEGRPEQDVTMQDLTSGYSDVNGDDWYAEGVAWASENGIASGYGNGQFNPNDSITREQFAVMLWKYAGSPQANNQVLSFTDADQASGYAQEALCWAVEKGILNGYTNGQLAPGGTTTRAEAAQMLKNFMENT